MSVENELIEIFAQKGIYIPQNTKKEALFLDSLQFVSVIVEIEEKFNIEIDDSFYINKKTHSFNDFVDEIKKVMKL